MIFSIKNTENGRISVRNEILYGFNVYVCLVEYSIRKACYILGAVHE